MDQPEAILILGPTASGKTALSLALARQVPCEIISVDSALIYRGMDIGSAKPSAADRSVCPHHLIDIREIDESYSAADFREDALRLIAQIRSRGRIPLVVGGTMLYAKALREGIDELPTSTPEVREKVNREGESLGWAAMHRRLEQIDPATASRLAPGDSQRIARALEVFELSGRALSSFYSEAKEPDPAFLVVGLMPADRARLHAAISERFDVMIAAGLMDEVRHLMGSPRFNRDSSAMRCVGYRQAVDVLLGESSWETFAEKGKAATRQLAKRQMTWLRSMRQVKLFDPYNEAAAAFQFLFDQAKRIAEKQFKIA